MRNRTWILHDFLLLSIMAGGVCFGSSLNPPLPGSWNSFRIGDATHSLMRMEIQFLPAKEGPRERFQPAGLLGGHQAPADRLLSCSWPASPPDRDDHFSVRWAGFWYPGEGTHEIRLRASHHATLSLDGQPLLECQGCPAGVTAVLEVDGRTHPLQLDYSHAGGAAYVFLDWREPGRAWYPVEVKSERRNEDLEGWMGEYYLGENYEHLAISRTDPQIAFDWKTGGPFDRPEDLPMLAFRWGHREGAFLGEVSSTREGYLWIIPYSTSPQTPDTSTLKGTNTSLSLLSSDGSTLLGMLFDEGGTWWSAGIEADHLPPTSLPAQAGLEEIGFMIPVHPERPIRFWEEAPGTSGGSWVTNTLNGAWKDFERSRPHLGEDLSDGDTALFSSGRWWIRVLQEALEHGGGLVMGTAPLSSPTRQHLLTSVSAGIPAAVSAMTSLCMPDLTWESQGLSTPPVTAAISGILQTEATGDLEFLGGVLRELQSPGGKPGPAIATQVAPERWPVHGVSRGLGAALSSFMDVRTILAVSEDGGFQILPVKLIQRTVKIENWATSGGMSLDLTLSPTGVRIEQRKGVYLQFDHLIAIREFRVGKRGEWTMKARVEGRVNLEAGPAKSLRDASWNHAPLLMTKREERFLHGTLPAGEGEIRVEWTEREKKIPRF